MNRVVAAGATLAAVSLGAFGALPAVAHPGHPATLAEIKSLNAKYANVRLAVANGYRPEGACVSSPQGAMGIHYLNPRLVASPAIVSRQPEILLYVPRAGGGLRLVGVEYFKVDADQRLATAFDRPRLFGRAFEGPMMGHGPGMPVHYDRHVWLYAPNPRGMFALYNPTLTCSPPAP